MELKISEEERNFFKKRMDAENKYLKCPMYDSLPEYMEQRSLKQLDEIIEEEREQEVLEKKRWKLVIK